MSRSKRIKDPYPGYGGSAPHPVLALGIVLIALAFGVGAWALGSDEGGYEQVEKLASVKCLGCLGLDPVIPPFESFWISYPEGHRKQGEEVEHSELVISTIDDEETDVMVLFFWTQGCVPCAAQWEEMKDIGIASGPEDGGREGDYYERFVLISYDAAESDGRALYETYTPTGTENGVPMTTFLFRGPDGSVQWYSHYGRMELDAMMDLMEDIQHYLETGSLKDDYDDIAHAD
jgi:hypothetical protein